MSDRVEGLAAWSESIMVIAFDEALQNGFSFRLSRYPEHDASWVWLHVIHDGRFYAYADNRLPSATGRCEPEASSADYQVPGLAVRMVREGTSADLTAIRFSAALGAHESLAAPEGEGPVAVTLEGAFQPGPLKPGALPGRFERAGTVDATITVAGRAHRLAGSAKAHEQTQTNPRFGVPFTYAMLWGPTASMVALSANRRGGGDFETGDSDLALERFAIAPKAPTRRFEIQPRDGAPLAGVAEAAFAFEVPVFGRRWQGSIVSARVGEHRMVGMINDWRAADQTYDL